MVKGRWRDLVDGFWLVPGLVSLLGSGLALLLLWIDHLSGRAATFLAFGGSPSAARSILSTIAGSLITVAGLIFSLTITTLQLASNQFTPRALRAFLSDRITQVVAGGFVGIFGYCLLVLTSVRSKAESGDSFVPSLSVTVAIGLGFLGLALLLVFIHHTAQSIQVANIAARIAHETTRAIDHLYPSGQGKPRDVDAAGLVRAWRDEAAPTPVRAARPGYVQSVALDDLLDGAARRGLRLHLRARPGDFVAPGDTIAEVWPAGAADDACVKTVRRAVTVVAQRDIHQDAAFGVRQLADIALKALSPGINDATTAITCINYLRTILDLLAGRDLPADVRCGATGDEAGGATVAARQHTFREYVEVFVEIGRVATDNARVAGATLDALAAIAATAARHGLGERLATLVEVADAVATPALADARTDHDRALLGERRARVARAARLSSAPSALRGAMPGTGVPPALPGQFTDRG